LLLGGLYFEFRYNYPVAAMRTHKTTRLKIPAILLLCCLVLPSSCFASGVVVKTAEAEASGCHESPPASSMQAPMRCPICCDMTQQQQAAITTEKSAAIAALPVAIVSAIDSPSLCAMQGHAASSNISTSPPERHFPLRI
jgi:hypothetical protein